MGVATQSFPQTTPFGNFATVKFISGSAPADDEYEGRLVYTEAMPAIAELKAATVSPAFHKKKCVYGKGHLLTCGSLGNVAQWRIYFYQQSGRTRP